MTDTSHEEQYTFFIISRSVLLRIRNNLEKFVDKIKTHILCSLIFFFFENHDVYEIMWKNTVEPDRGLTTIQRLRVACWIPKATNTHIHTGCVMLISFPLQRWLHEGASVLCYTYTACLVLYIS